MQLFALIAQPESNAAERRMIVNLFLRQKLNSQVSKEYLQLYGEYYRLPMGEHTGSKAKEKVVSRNSVKVLKICREIKKELTQAQKIVLLISLWGFVKTGGITILQQESKIVRMVADAFYLSRKSSFPSNSL